MLAGETFTDEPSCVCPVIAEFLRTYNDQVNDARRQDLFAYAALVVETRDDTRGERRRANICLERWLEESAPQRPQLRRLLWMLSPSLAARDIEIAHRAARWAAASPDRHAWALRVVEEMAGCEPLRIKPVADAGAANAVVAEALAADALAEDPCAAAIA